MKPPVEELDSTPRSPEEKRLEDAFVSRLMGSFFVNFEADLARSPAQANAEQQIRAASRLSRQATIDAIRAQLLELSKSRLAEAKLQASGLLELLASQVEDFAGQPLPRHQVGLLMPPRPQGRCRSASDGDCDWPGCPQTRDGEPAKTGRACPLLEEHVTGTPVYAPHVRPRVSPETRAQEILASESDGPMSNLLHTLWTKAVGSPEYDKWEWQALELVLYRMRRKLHGDFLP